MSYVLFPPPPCRVCGERVRLCVVCRVSCVVCSVSCVVCVLTFSSAVVEATELSFPGKALQAIYGGATPCTHPDKGPITNHRMSLGLTGHSRPPPIQSVYWQPRAWATPTPGCRWRALWARLRSATSTTTATRTAPAPSRRRATTRCGSTASPCTAAPPP